MSFLRDQFLRISVGVQSGEERDSPRALWCRVTTCEIRVFDVGIGASVEVSEKKFFPSKRQLASLVLSLDLFGSGSLDCLRRCPKTWRFSSVLIFRWTLFSPNFPGRKLCFQVINSPCDCFNKLVSLLWENRSKSSLFTLLDETYFGTFLLSLAIRSHASLFYSLGKKWHVAFLLWFTHVFGCFAVKGVF